MDIEEDQGADGLSTCGIDVPMLATHTVGDLEATAAALRADEPEIEIQNWLNLTTVLVARAKEIRRMVEQVAIEWINKNGPVQVGDIEYTVGHNKTVRCVDVPRCTNLILESGAGDVSSIVNSLRTDPFKYGTVRSLIGEANFFEVFRTETKPKILYGTLQPQLLKANLRFFPPRQKSKIK
jgi:hypothetical protein